MGEFGRPRVLEMAFMLSSPELLGGHPLSGGSNRTDKDRVQKPAHLDELIAGDCQGDVFNICLLAPRRPLLLREVIVPGEKCRRSREFDLPVLRDFLDCRTQHNCTEAPLRASDRKSM